MRQGNTEWLFVPIKSSCAESSGTAYLVQSLLPSSVQQCPTSITPLFCVPSTFLPSVYPVECFTLSENALVFIYTLIFSKVCYLDLL